MTRQTGTVAKWLNHRGIGFITPDGQETAIGDDLLVHYSHIQQQPIGKDTFKTLAVGSRVEFDTTADPKNPGKRIAVCVTGVGGGDCERLTATSYKTKNKRGLYPVLVDNLTEEISWRDLKDHFRKCGFVDRVDIVTPAHSNLVDKGLADRQRQAIVRFLNEADAQKAVNEFSEFDFQGQTLRARRGSE
jgi:cold shock CspA family protein